ncbi:MAG TPA: hypothetical protein VMA34_00220 [Terracidiphilus sp.]|nr:hypothetical protein [Terracidiphilus sp.]
MTESSQPIAEYTNADLEAMLRRALRNTLLLGLIPSIVLWIASGWRNAAMLATGTAISAASILEWRRLARFLSARLDGQPPPKGAAVAVLFLVLRLTVFAGGICVSLRCFRGSSVALLCGLALAVVVMAWEGLRLLRQ